MKIDILLPNGALKLLPARAYDGYNLRLLGHILARYGFPTVELIDWLRDYIAGRDAIEIGAGSGDLCHHLGIPGTDNFMQTWPDIAAYYGALRQPTIKYGSWVENLDALDAVRKYRPQVVVACWVTHFIDPALPMPPGGGNMYGVREDELLPLVDTYIMIGNLTVHRHKPIMRQPHDEFALPFLRSRSVSPQLDRVFVWNTK